MHSNRSAKCHIGSEFFSTSLDVACDISPSTDQITHLNSAFELRDP